MGTALRTRVLRKKAERFEQKKLQVLKVTKERASSLEPLLQDVYASQRPKPSDYSVRRDIIHVFNEIAKDIYGRSKDIPAVVEFGSFVMDLFSPSSDLDLSVNFSSADGTFPREKKIQALRKFARKLYALKSKGHVSRVLPVTSAKVPILKCVDRGTGVECDISIENRDGILKSKFIRIISSIDERFHKLSFLMKIWAKAHGINSSKDKTLNSLSIILLVSFHLQTRNPPILPPFSDIFKDGTKPAKIKKMISKFARYGESNKESLAELFVTLLIKLSSVEKLWPKGICASPRNGSWMSKTWDSKVACISVEDITDPTQNVARAVGPGEVKQIYKCIEISLRLIFAFMDGQIGVQMRDYLFGQGGNAARIPRGINLPPIVTLACIAPPATKTARAPKKRRRQGMRHDSALPSRKISVGTGPQSSHWGQVEQNMAPESNSVKRMRVDEAWRGMPSRNWATTQAGNLKKTTKPGGWKDTERPSAEGWGGSVQASKGWGGTSVTSGSWGHTSIGSDGGWERASEGSKRSWGQTSITSMGGWGKTQRGTGEGWETASKSEPSGGGWGGSRKHTGTWEPNTGPSSGRMRRGTGEGWETASKSEPSGGGWGGSRKVTGTWEPNTGAGWGRMQRGTGEGWETASKSEPSGGGWGGSRKVTGTWKPNTGAGWGSMRRGTGEGWETASKSEPSGGGWGGSRKVTGTWEPNTGAGWGGAQKHVPEGWRTETSNSVWKTDSNNTNS